MNTDVYQNQNVILSTPTFLVEKTNNLADDLGISYNDLFLQAIFAYLMRDVDDPVSIKLDNLYARKPELKEAIFSNVVPLMSMSSVVDYTTDTENEQQQTDIEFPVVDCGPWPDNLSLRR
ncbi:MAG: hypothetical protein AAF639_18280 [Chloroflexota bacterium]